MTTPYIETTARDIIKAAQSMMNSARQAEQRLEDLHDTLSEANRDNDRLRLSLRRAYAAMWTLSLLLFVLSLLVLSSAAFAHQAAADWEYPYQCCSGDDCREVPATSVTEDRNGYRVPSGELLRFNDRRLRPSPDGLFHWCAIGATTRCLFVPTPAT